MDIETLINLAPILAIGLLAGSLNSVAGGGSFFSLPVLLAAGLPPVTAQVTNHLGLLPANGMALLPFKNRIYKLRYRLLKAILYCTAAGIAGGFTLILFPPTVFENIVPFLVLAATTLYWLEPKLKKILKKIAQSNETYSISLVRSLQIIVAFYCGYFGAGVGFLFLLAFALEGYDELIDTQCMKNTVVSIIGILVLFVFIWGGGISWTIGLTLFLGSAIGGFAGGKIIESIPQKILRTMIICVGVGLAIGYFTFY